MEEMGAVLASTRSCPWVNLVWVRVITGARKNACVNWNISWRFFRSPQEGVCRYVDHYTLRSRHTPILTADCHIGQSPTGMRFSMLLMLKLETSPSQQVKLIIENVCALHLSALREFCGP